MGIVKKVQKENKTSEKLPTSPRTSSLRPFVKWAGGKGHLLQKLERHFPRSFSTYYEPFLGGGAIFFRLVEKRPRFNVVLSDSNAELINAYNVVKNNVAELVKQLRLHATRYKLSPKEYYYRVRDETPWDSVGRAAHLIFLNRTCYNGLYRVNKMNKFNVPFGRYKNPTICDEENLLAVNEVLRRSNTKLLAADYRKTTEDAGKGDFIYFDPPYQPESATANFTSYTNSGFSFDDQMQLGKWFKELDGKGCQLLLSNSNTKEVREIYREYDIREVETLRAINCKANSRRGHIELIISNHACLLRRDRSDTK
jgi:DNA adenine methylase